MRKCVVLLLASVASVASSLGACAPGAEPTPAEIPTQPLVIGTSTAPPGPVVAADPDSRPVTDQPIAAADPSRTSGLAIPARDPRAARPARPRALVVTELQALEQLFAATAATAPDRPVMARRLAEDYAELARAAGADAVAATAHKSALKYYELIPTIAPRDPRIDEAYYYAGLEHELTGDLRGARMAYFNLIKTAPQSKLIPLGYFAFGEMFFAEASADPSKYDLAEQAYRETLKFPAPQNTLFTEARDRLAEIAKLRGGAGGAITRP